MPSIIVNEQHYPVAPGATVLDALLDAGLELSHGCRAGACHSCLLRAIDGDIPSEAQQGLKAPLKSDGWFLPCRCVPTETMTLDLNASVPLTMPASVVEKRPLSPRIMGIWLQTEVPLEYRAGQFITLWRDELTGRSYSIASLPGEDVNIELHIARIEGGAVSPWVHDSLQVGDEVVIQGPMGDCFYTSGQPEQPLLLVGTGTGLAPMYGVVRDALRQGHSGPIHLFHGARSSDYLYYHGEMLELSRQYDNLYYHPSMVESYGHSQEGIEFGPIDQLVTKHLPDLSGWRVYLSGAADIVNQLRRQCFLAGASLEDILTDPFS